MDFKIILLIIISISFTISIFYFIGYNKLSIIKAKMDSSNTVITKTLKEKYELMDKLYSQIKRATKKKDYLKGFNELKKKNLGNYEFDIELSNYFKTILEIKEDNKNLDTDEFNTIINKIQGYDELLIANKKYFNKNNNILSKELKGYIKIIASINNIKTQTSYETK